jgi:Tol biopolymer transport system component
MRRLTDARERDYYPAWSADGWQIIFTSERIPELYVMNAEGSLVRRLTDNT